MNQFEPQNTAKEHIVGMGATLKSRQKTAFFLGGAKFSMPTRVWMNKTKFVGNQKFVPKMNLL